VFLHTTLPSVLKDVLDMSDSQKGVLFFIYVLQLKELIPQATYEALQKDF
jgi:hypothetical protein